MDSCVNTLNIGQIFCQPCKEQDQEKEAMYWCAVCPELLCESCYGHHKALKATRDHKMLGVEEYRIIGSGIAEMDLYCQKHPSEGIKFVCFTHSLPCCILCKSDGHGENCDIKLKEEILGNQNIEDTMNSTVEILQKINLFLSNNTYVKDFEVERNMFYEEIKNGRQQVEDVLDEYEQELKHKFEEVVSAKNYRIKETMKTLEHKTRELMKRKETIEKVNEMSGFPELKKCLINNKFHRDNTQDQLHYADMCETCEGVEDNKFLNNFTNVYKFNSQKHEIRLANGYVIKWGDKVEREFDNIENSSSTVEAEDIGKEIIQANNQITEVDSSGRETERGHDKSIQTDQMSKADSSTEETKQSFDKVTQTDHTNQVETLKEENEMSSRHLNEVEQLKNSESYIQTKHFFIARRNKDIKVMCARFLTENTIVLSETSEKRLLVYRTNGYKLGQVEFEEEPDEIAVIDNSRVAVAVEKNIVFVDVADFTIQSGKFLRDFIKGLAYANPNIYACLKHRGITILDMDGDILRTVPFIKGDLYVCALNNGTIFTAKNTSSTFIHSYNVHSKRKDIFSSLKISHINGITCDLNGHIYAVNVRKVFKLDTETKLITVILSPENGLKHVYNVDCIGDDLLVIDGGNEVKIFKKQ